ncbi:type IV pili twitching motility protein PilT [Prochlorococcus marinus str. MU1404]|uniref:type IV pilus twitching motility protein PilT n=1 Tax=Prochlorococcus marinus TaxID=1219 RepID=UPI001AD9A4C5|nr:type IV pilus twitching motility protein PilT [Prochlorococcus marinus]MBO8229882.1 type IV pilus twitching motility protein PilT [Prochlorococcus marinus XMU1404]MBW3073333.1 type IV pili twitching motility protein PilT [Prochlorococcus marinus str. MU1404]MCR8545782.1 type IV pilus twitching motility protein PilT [Prochlorococcus marinus CUG1432]
MSQLDLTITNLMSDLVKRNGSDLHLTGDSIPFFRIQGSILPASENIFKEDHLISDLKEILGEDKIRSFYNEKELDCSYGLEGIARFRLNIFFDRGKISCVMRALSTKIPSFSQIGLPDSVQQLLQRPRGLILVTGPTGSGKTTTLASSIDWINSNNAHHILTIEDPIEFVFENKNCLVRQREVGEDTISFSKALRSALREDPDIILVGEMRDLETISLAITAAETGHLVMGTLHTSSASQTIDRIIDVFPTSQQQQIRVQLSGSLIGVISQTLCKTKENKRTLAAEILVNNNAIANLIREAKSSQVYSQLQVGAKYGMQTLEQALSRNVISGAITKEEAFYKCNRPNVLQGLLDNEENNEN